MGRISSPVCEGAKDEAYSCSENIFRGLLSAAESWALCLHLHLLTSIYNFALHIEPRLLAIQGVWIHTMRAEHLKIQEHFLPSAVYMSTIRWRWLSAQFSKYSYKHSRPGLLFLNISASYKQSMPFSFLISAALGDFFLLSTTTVQAWTECGMSSLLCMYVFM